MPAAIRNITIEQGASFRLQVTWKSGGEPVNLTGFSAEAQVRGSYSSSAPALTFATADGSIELGGSDGTIVLTALPEATRAARTTDGTGVWDLELTDGAGEVTRLLQGKVRISKEATR